MLIYAGSTPNHKFQPQNPRPLGLLRPQNKVSLQCLLISIFAINRFSYYF